jgi:beta-lactam-binding protein with PASTA domain
VIAVVPDPVVVPVTSAPPAVHCTVPKLKGLTLARVKTRLERAHCKLGAVHRPIGLPSSTKLNVLRQAPRAGQRRAAGLRVAVLLAPPAAAHG